MLAPHIGSQEYKALAYCINHNYQIISEDNIFDMLFETMNYNKVFISNSLVLLEKLLEYDNYISLIIDLDKKNYKHVLDVEYTSNLVSFMRENEVINLLTGEKRLIKIANSYGFLEKIKRYYKDKFKVLYPKSIVPTKNFFDKNIEQIFKIINSEKL